MATFGKGGGEGEVILPILEYDELEREVDKEDKEGEQEEDDAAEEDAAVQAADEASKVPSGVGRPAWDPGPMANWGAEHGWGLQEGDIPSLTWDTRRWRMSRPRVQALEGGQLRFQCFYPLSGHGWRIAAVGLFGKADGVSPLLTEVQDR